MGRAPCCDKNNVKKGPWSPEEDAKLKEFIEKHGTGGNWIALPQKAGLRRCGKSCRLRWLNYLRPNIKHGEFTEQEDRVICSMFASIGSRWSIIASQLPGRTDNDIKNYWNTKLKKKLLGPNAGAPPQRVQRQYHHHHHHRQPPLLLPHSPSSLAHPAGYNSFFSGPGALQDPVAIPSSLTLPTTTTHQDYVFGHGGLPMASASALLHHQLQLQVKEESSSMIVFGSDQPSCSSSDGAHSHHHHHQFGHHGKELSFDGYSYGYGGAAAGIEQDNSIKQLFQQDHQAQLDYNYEEIKHLLMNTNAAAAAAGLHHQHQEASAGSLEGKVTMM